MTLFCCELFFLIIFNTKVALIYNGFGEEVDFVVFAIF